MRRREDLMLGALLDWLGLIGRAGVLIAIAAVGFATLGLLHP